MQWAAGQGRQQRQHFFGDHYPVKPFETAAIDDLDQRQLPQFFGCRNRTFPRLFFTVGLPWTVRANFAKYRREFIQPHRAAGCLQRSQRFPVAFAQFAQRLSQSV